MKRYDAIVIGAGPAGITAALYLARFGVELALVEKLTPGGLLLQTHSIENYPGFAKAKGYELADAMADQLEAYTFDRYQGSITIFEPSPGKNRLRVGDDWIEGRTVVIAAGLHYQKLGLPDEDRLTGRGVSYCAICDGHFYKNKVVGVVGGGNAALEESLYLASIVKELHLFHRREQFRADKIYQEKIGMVNNIHIHRNVIVTSLHGEEELTGVTIGSTVCPDSSFFPVDGLFIFAGQSPSSEFLPDTLESDEEGFLITDTEMRTNLPGIFAAGDIRSKLCRQVATAVGDGATAANAAYAYLEHADV